MNRIARLIKFIKSTGEKYRTIQTRIKSTILIKIATIHFYFTQYLIPGILPFLNQSIKTIVSKLFQVSVCLLKTDKGRGYTSMHDFSFTGFKTNNCTCMSGLLFFLILCQNAIGNRSLISERLVELNDKVVLEVIGHSTTVTGCISDNLILFRNNFNIRSFVESIHYNI